MFFWEIVLSSLSSLRASSSSPVIIRSFIDMDREKAFI